MVNLSQGLVKINVYINKYMKFNHKSEQNWNLTQTKASNHEIVINGQTSLYKALPK